LPPARRRRQVGYWRCDQKEAQGLAEEFQKTYGTGAIIEKILAVMERKAETAWLVGCIGDHCANVL
jgi:hypothetical protein